MFCGDACSLSADRASTAEPFQWHEWLLEWVRWTLNPTLTNCYSRTHPPHAALGWDVKIYNASSRIALLATVLEAGYCWFYIILPWNISIMSLPLLFFWWEIESDFPDCFFDACGCHSLRKPQRDVTDCSVCAWPGSLTFGEQQNCPHNIFQEMVQMTSDSFWSFYEVMVVKPQCSTLHLLCFGGL